MFAEEMSDLSRQPVGPLVTQWPGRKQEHVLQRLGEHCTLPAPGVPCVFLCLQEG